MRVCLINPPRTYPKNWGKPSVFQPIDLAYMAAVLEKQHKVTILDAIAEGWKNLEEIGGTAYLQGLKNEEIAQRVKERQPELVGINIPFSGWCRPTYDAASAIKAACKDTKIFLSGLHPSTRPADCLAHPDIDFAVIGEPEQTVSELVSVLEQGDPRRLGEVNGLGFLRDGKPVINQPRCRVLDLDSLPFPARHLLPMQAYFAAVKENPLRGEICKPWAFMITSRGCPYHCVFCPNHNVTGRQWRGRSPKNVVDEIEQVVKTFHVEQIEFFDDNMTLDRNRMEGICDLIMQRGLDIEWFTPNGVRADKLDEPLLKKMKSSGCKNIRVAPESGVQRVVDQVIKKSLNLKDVENAVVMARRVGLKVGCFFVIGLIGETKADIEETIRYAYKLKKLGADHFYFSTAMPIYGTELYEQAKSCGYLKDDFGDDALAAVDPLIETPEFTEDDIKALSAKANMINYTLTRHKVVLAVKNPRKAIKFLLGRR